MYKTSWTSVDKIAVLFVQEDLFNFQYKYTIYNTISGYLYDNSNVRPKSVVQLSIIYSLNKMYSTVGHT